ncbi:MAG: retron St85 family RNA-directed DNA polymerase [Bacillota bacterium]|jgi:RNA-directed DNA polymerase
MSLLDCLANDLDLDPRFIVTISRFSHRYYRKFKIPKKSGGVRWIFQPSAALKSLQYWLVHHVVSCLPVHECATAYRLGCSIKNNALFHANSKHLVRLDIRDFFPSIGFDLLAQRIAESGSNIPNGEAIKNEDLRLIKGIGFFRGRLTIGSVCAPAISNAVMYPFDCFAAEYAKSHDLIYTRYADDIVFSGPEFIPRSIVNDMSCKLKEFGFILNDHKTIFMGGSGRKVVTGVFLNTGKPSIGRVRKDFIKRLIYRHLRYQEGNSAEILGHLNYLRDIEPETFNRIVRKYSLMFGTNLMEVLKRAREIESFPKEAAATVHYRKV